MPIWKQILLNVYYHGTYPIRCWTGRCALRDDRVPIIVLLYHRIADDRANEWTTSNRTFAKQIRWLRKRFELISLAEAQRRIRRGMNHRPCVSITFDDGYADNCRQAIPLLVKHRIPCTYFVTLRNVLHEEPFSHDMVMGYLLAPNTMEQIKAMAGAGIEIGAHAYTHADLAAINDTRLLRYEVVAATDELQQQLDRPVRYFAFPYGQRANLSPAAFEMARQAGCEGVCSAYGGFNFPGDDDFHLQRIAVDDDMIGMKNWVTGDPRKLNTQRFVYEEADSKLLATEA